MAQNQGLFISYYQSFDGEITEGFLVKTPDDRLQVTAQRHGYDSFNLWTFDADTDQEPVRAESKFSFAEAMLEAMTFCGMVAEANTTRRGAKSFMDDSSGIG